MTHLDKNDKVSDLKNPLAADPKRQCAAKKVFWFAVVRMSFGFLFKKRRFCEQHPNNIRMKLKAKRLQKLENNCLFECGLPAQEQLGTRKGGIKTKKTAPQGCMIKFNL